MTNQLPQKTVTTPLPANETERLAALHRYKILDTSPEIAFDRITALAARLFDLPISLVSLVDESRAWFKSSIGFDASEVPRDATLCSFALLTNEPLIVPDTRQDDRFACNPFVQSEPGVRFYAGAPLLTPDGFNLGTLCLLDTQPHEPLTPKQQATLVDLAAMVVDELELRLAAHRIAQVDAALLEITQAVATVTGDAFFSTLVQHLARALDADYAYIGLVEGGELKRLRTIATCAHAQLVDNLEYSLQDTPCWEVIEQRKICCYPRHVQAQFPDAPLLKPLSVESYVAVPCFDSSGKLLGLLGVMDGKPLEQVQLAESLLTIFALRIATELERQRTEAALQESEERFRTLADNISQLAWMANENGWIFWYNRRWFDYTGTTLGEMQGWGWQQVHHPDHVDRVVKHIRHCFETGEQWEDTFPLRGRDGTYRWFLSRAIPIRDEQGRILQWFGTNTDITERKQAELEIQKFVSLADNSGEFIGMCDMNFVPFYVNPAGQQLVGLDGVQQYIETSVRDFFFPEDQDFVINEFFPRVLREGRAEVEIRFRHFKTGAALWMLYNVFYIRGENKQPIGLAAVSRNITERKQAETTLQEQATLLQLIIDSIGDGLILANPKGEVVLVNQAAERIFGPLTNEHPCEEWAQTYGLYLPDQQTLFPDQQLPLYRAIQGEPANDIEVFVRRNPTAEGRWVSVSGFPVSDRSGNITGGVITCRDVTERKRILQQEQAAREAAERANRIKDEFLAVLSHELRSPLNPILGWTRLLQTGKLDATRQAEAIATIERNAKLQSQLIEDLLDIARIMQGKLTLTATPTSLAFVISAALETVQLAAEAKNIAIVLDLTSDIAPVFGDAARLQQVVWNLLTNAVKFTPSGGQVTVKLKQIGQSAHIRVIDTGKGINPEFLPHVFEYFRQEDGSTTRRFGGLGLGLAIVRQIVELHGGTVSAESAGENQGATFSVQLPVMLQTASITPRPSPTPSETKAPLDNIQVLLVDDDTDTREFQAFLLEQYGAKVTAVSSGAAALEVLEQFVPDVIVSDVGMPHMDGYMLMQQLRALPPEQGGQTPAIALTAYVGEVNHQQALQAGFQQHLAKPIEPDKLIKAITTLVGKK
ncbi:PAS domain S-box protein [Trichocoleus sp. FACHB-262]|uniref:PAS domain S-box protein n=1 Tax=Trichocoleus sp. FACHB-262 TaxID=2692869 RepID=UPI0016839B28|nr:PAS domain S-box protein [Trichocoleus sp. FACHB-262]MBD2121327.1 PAS domain S-box protein [Trichocoleus sp. FACHB-262]